MREQNKREENKFEYRGLLIFRRQIEGKLKKVLRRSLTNLETVHAVS